MNPDSEGFLYPKTSKENCIQCGLCERVCPLGEPKSKREPKEILAATNENEHILELKTEWYLGLCLTNNGT